VLLRPSQVLSVRALSRDIDEMARFLKDGTVDIYFDSYSD
jgi:hypothetical protein